jgi:hypothetical protein
MESAGPAVTVTSRRSGVAAAAAATLGLLLVARSAGAAACPEAWSAAAGPLPAGVGPADFGAVPEACPASEIALRARGTLLVASAAPDFFGSVAAGATLRARLLVGERTWISLALDAVTFRYVANAVVTSSGLAFGPPTVGVHRALGHRDDLALAVYLRALLPLDTAREEGVETGGEAGIAARLTAGPGAHVGLEGGLALPVPVDVVGGQAHPALRPAALVEGWWAPRPSVALFAGVGARAQAAPDPSFTSLAPRAAARFALRRGVWLAALVEVPVVGADRTDLVAALYAGWTPSPP